MILQACRACRKHHATTTSTKPARAVVFVVVVVAVILYIATSQAAFCIAQKCSTTTKATLARRAPKRHSLGSHTSLTVRVCANENRFLVSHINSSVYSACRGCMLRSHARVCCVRVCARRATCATHVCFNGLSETAAVCAAAMTTTAL